MSSPKFKVGDKVRVKGCDDLQQTGKIAPEMLQYQKKEAVITEVFDDDGYNYTLDICEAIWYWYEDMIDLIEAAPIEEKCSPKFKVGDRVSIDHHPQPHLNGRDGIIEDVYDHTAWTAYRVLVDHVTAKGSWLCSEDTLTLVPNLHINHDPEKVLTECKAEETEDGMKIILGTSKDPEATPENNGGLIKRLEEPHTLESLCEHRALLRHYDGCFVTFCPRCGKILHVYHTVNLLRGYALVEGRIRELENKKGE